MLEHVCVCVCFLMSPFIFILNQISLLFFLTFPRSLFVLPFKKSNQEWSKTRNYWFIVSLVTCSTSNSMRVRLICAEMKRSQARKQARNLTVGLFRYGIWDVCVYFTEYNGFSFSHRKVLIIFGMCFVLVNRSISWLQSHLMLDHE